MLINGNWYFTTVVALDLLAGISVSYVLSQNEKNVDQPLLAGGRSADQEGTSLSNYQNLSKISALTRVWTSGKLRIRAIHLCKPESLTAVRLPGEEDRAGLDCLLQVETSQVSRHERS